MRCGSYSTAPCHRSAPPETSSAKLVASLTCATAMGSCRAASRAMCAYGQGAGRQQEVCRSSGWPCTRKTAAFGMHVARARANCEPNPESCLTLSRRLESYSLIFLRAMAAS